MKRFATSVVLVVAGIVLGYGTQEAQETKKEEPKMDTRYFELRIYTAAPGKMNDLQARFRDHTVKLFEKHGMTNVGYWVQTNAKEGADEKLYYILAYPSKKARDDSWAAFQKDPDWTKALKESEKDGKLTSKVENLYLTPTDFSQIK